jgi:hypothetical protein
VQYLSLHVTQISHIPELPPTSVDDVTEYNYADICLRFCLLSVSVIAGCKFFKNLNYGNKMEALRPGYKACNNMSV